MATQGSAIAGWRLEGLAATEPDPTLREKLSLFGQFVGDWEITECRSLERDGSWSVSRGEVHWRWILDGRAVQDIWTTLEETTQRSVPIGTTIRFYDAGIDAWRSVWLSPAQGMVRPFIGRAVGSEIVLDGAPGNTRDGRPIRWIFSEITHDRFRWRAEELDSPASDWVLYEEMRIRRTPSA